MKVGALVRAHGENPMKASWHFLVLMFLLPLASGCSDEISAEHRDLYAKALVAYNDRNFQQAERLAAEILEDHPSWDQPRMLRAKVLFFTRRFGPAEKDLRTIIDQDANHPYANLWLAKVLATNPERLGEAIEILGGIVRRNPDDLVAHYYLARCLEQNGDLQKAILHYQQSLGAEYHLSKAHLHLGTLLQAHRLEDRAEEHFRRVERLGVNKEDAQRARDFLSSRRKEDE